MPDDDAFQPPGDHDYRPPAGFFAIEEGQKFIMQRITKLPTRLLVVRFGVWVALGLCVLAIIGLQMW
jgi:hypothetical protein